MLATQCAICRTEGNATQVYPSNVHEDAFNPVVFSARRLPDRLHYRMVRCNTCGLVRSDPVAAPETLEQLYAQSTFDYGAEVDSIRRTYGRHLRGLDALGARKGCLLEIGCGNGFFLEEALAQGYADVRGVEPSGDALERAHPSVRNRIVCDIMRPGLFEPEQFDVVCMFQVLDHIPNPGELLDECFRVLKPGGLLLCINHNVDALSARILGERSPIVDVEHTYLYSLATMRRMFEQYQFIVRSVTSVYNTYPLRYLVRLVPLPPTVKEKALSVLDRSGAGGVTLSVPLGNLSLVAAKP